MRLVLLGLAEVRISPADEHVLALDSRHDAYVILGAALDRHLHSQLDNCCPLKDHALRKASTLRPQMSALGSEADVTLLNFDVRFTPESGHSTALSWSAPLEPDRQRQVN